MIELSDVVMTFLPSCISNVDIALFNAFINSHLFEEFLRKFSQSIGTFAVGLTFFLKPAPRFFLVDSLRLCGKH